MSIYNTIAVITFICVVTMMDPCVGRQTRRPHKCSVCSHADRLKCKPLPDDCERIPEPNCGCCMMCAKKEGENCGVATGTCESDLECIPPPLSPEDYMDYGPANYFMEAFLGNFICVTRKKFLDILTGDFYFDEPNSEMGTMEIPDLETLSILEEISETFENDYTAQPNSPTSLGSTHNTETTPRPSTPIASTFQHSDKPCKKHDDSVWRKEHFDHHEWIPSCAHDGSYFPEQCELSYGLERGRCWCVDSKGRPISGFTDGDKAHPQLCYDAVIAP